MSVLTIYDPTKDDSMGSFRGGGRVMNTLLENLKGKARFINSLDKVSEKDTLLIPLWQPYQKPLLAKRLAHKQILIIFDAIPMKYPEQFPIGLRGRIRLFQSLNALFHAGKALVDSLDDF